MWFHTTTTILNKPLVLCVFFSFIVPIVSIVDVATIINYCFNTHVVIILGKTKDNFFFRVEIPFYLYETTYLWLTKKHDELI